MFLVFLLFFCISSLSFADEVNKCSDNANDPAWFAGRTPPRDGQWYDLPSVYICHGAPVSESRVRKALSYWEKLGYKFEKIVDNSTVSACIIGGYEPNAIVISLVGQDFDFDYLAMTRVYRQTQTRAIVGARIEIQKPHANTPRVLEHEIGHSLGWGHIRRRYHMMHPEREFGGNDSYGLRNKFPVCLYTINSYSVEEILYLD